MVIGAKQRTLEKLAYRYWLKHPSWSSEKCWKAAELLLAKLEKRRDKYYGSDS